MKVSTPQEILTRLHPPVQVCYHLILSDNSRTNNELAAAATATAEVSSAASAVSSAASPSAAQATANAGGRADVAPLMVVVGGAVVAAYGLI